MVFAKHSHESAMGVHVFPILNPLPPPFPSHPSGSSQCTSPEHLVSCIEPGLVIYSTYDNIHVSILFSQIIPPSPLPQSPKDSSLHLLDITSFTVFFIFFLSPFQFLFMCLLLTLCTKEPPDEGERGEWKIWLKTQHSKNKDNGIRSCHFMANRWGNNGSRIDFKHCGWWLQPWN